MFSAEWLALREPADRKARSRTLTAEVVSHVNAGKFLSALDLASGTGANARYVAEFVDIDQGWLLADHDPLLLAAAEPRMSSSSWAHTCNAQFSTRNIDLRRLDAPSLFAGRALVTASALLDLVSEAWIATLADRCREAAATVLFALTYDGRMSADPLEPEDEMIRALVNRHQLTDKGFGAAAGPNAVDVASRAFSDRGYEIRRARSDWQLGPAEAPLQRELIQGWAAAASSISSENRAAIESWQVRRLEHVDRDRSTLVVGHEDIAGWLSPSL